MQFAETRAQVALDAPVPKAVPVKRLISAGRIRHAALRPAAVTRPRMGVKIAADIREGHKLRQLAPVAPLRSRRGPRAAPARYKGARDAGESLPRYSRQYTGHPRTGHLH